ncbi:MAG: DUF4388 domain-containing protein [Deltaproteobacteria bacterium]
MSTASAEPKPLPSRFSRFSRDTLIRVLAVVGERDDELVVQLRLDGFRVEHAAPADIESGARALGAEAILVDAEISGALAAVARLRRGEGVMSTIPIVLISSPTGALHTSLDAVESGGDVFIPRPVDAADLGARMHSLLEIPGVDASERAAPLRSTPPREPVPSLRPPSHVPPPAPTGISSMAGGLSAALAEVLRSAAFRVGGSEADMVLPSVDDEAIDELIPPELLEPLDAPVDPLGDDALTASPHTPPPVGPGGIRRSLGRGSSSAGRQSAPTPTITPLALGGELRLAGSLGPHGVGALLGAAWRARASGLVIVRSKHVEYALSVTSGHLLAIRSSRSDDDIGPLLVRLGAIPREAARFAPAPLDAGVRKAALVASRGYLSAEALAQALARAAREVAFDLLALPESEWEMRPLETAVEIPLAPRSLDVLLVLGARARIEPETAREALGGPDVTVFLKVEPSTLATLPLTRTEREAAQAARGVSLRVLEETYGADVLPGLLALVWLTALRVEGAGVDPLLAPTPLGALAQERTRVRALVEAATDRDLFALLGVSEWSTRRAALDGLEARRAELAGLRARHPDVSALATVGVVLEEVARMLASPDAWAPYVAAVRERTS